MLLSRLIHHERFPEVMRNVLNGKRIVSIPRLENWSLEPHLLFIEDKNQVINKEIFIWDLVMNAGYNILLNEKRKNNVVIYQPPILNNAFWYESDGIYWFPMKMDHYRMMKNNRIKDVHSLTYPCISVRQYCDVFDG